MVDEQCSKISEYYKSICDQNDHFAYRIDVILLLYLHMIDAELDELSELHYFIPTLSSQPPKNAVFWLLMIRILLCVKSLFVSNYRLHCLVAFVPFWLKRIPKHRSRQSQVIVSR